MPLPNDPTIPSGEICACKKLSADCATSVFEFDPVRANVSGTSESENMIERSRTGYVFASARFRPAAIRVMN